MLKTVVNSTAMKTTFCAVTYRAGRGNNFATCPKTCNLNPSGCGAAGIDKEYLNTLLDAVPAGGVERGVTRHRLRRVRVAEAL